jgi:hypothetical protein
VIFAVLFLLLCIAALVVGLVEGLDTPKGRELRQAFFDWKPLSSVDLASLELIARAADADVLSEFGI